MPTSCRHPKRHRKLDHETFKYKLPKTLESAWGLGPWQRPWKAKTRASQLVRILDETPACCQESEYGHMPSWEECFVCQVAHSLYERALLPHCVPQMEPVHNKGAKSTKRHRTLDNVRTPQSQPSVLQLRRRRKKGEPPCDTFGAARAPKLPIPIST